jgi:enterochelin esterase-like enzyme
VRPRERLVCHQDMTSHTVDRPELAYISLHRVPLRLLGSVAIALLVACGGSDAELGDSNTQDLNGTEGTLASLDALVASLKTASSDDARSKLVRSFMRDVEYSKGGFPIRENGKVAFAFFDPDRHPGTMSVAGDFNGFNATAAPLQTPVAGFPFFVRVEPLKAATARTRYKFVRSGREFFADPLARRFVYDDQGEISLVEAGDAASHLERWPAFDDHHGSLAARSLFVYVPPHYDAGKTPLPLLVMHDGQNLFDPSAGSGGWRVAEAADRGIASGKVRPVVIVGIPNTPARFDEYTHVPDTIKELGGKLGGKAPEYGDFVALGIVPFMRSHYRVGTTPATTGVLGSSLGGLVSFAIAQQHPEVFGFAGSMSGTMGWGSEMKNETMIDRYHKKIPTGLKLYLDSGGGDGGSCAEGRGSDNFCSNIQMKDTLKSGGLVEGKTFVYRFAPGAQHNEAEWAKRLPRALHDWFPGGPERGP